MSEGNEREYWSLSILLKDLNQGIEKLRKELKPYCSDDPEIQEFLDVKERDWYDFQRYVSDFYPGCPVGTLINSLRSKGIDSRFYGGMTHRGREYFNVSKNIEKIMMKIEIEDFYESERKKAQEKEMQHNNTDYCIFDEISFDEYEEMCEREGRS